MGRFINKRIMAGVLMVSLTLALTGFGFTVKRAGYVRQARFTTDIVYKIMAEYYKRYKIYPESFKKLPRFYVVSALDRYYLDSKNLADGRCRGYRYDLQLIGKDKFVISVSPIGFWPAPVEFGITEKGILKSNGHSVDGQADSYDEVEGWGTIPNLRQK